MIIKSRVTGKNVLSVFENFHTDRSLPKFNTPKKSGSLGGVEMKSASIGFSNAEDMDGEMDNITMPTIWQGAHGNMEYKGPVFGWKYRLVAMIERLLGIPKPKGRQYGKASPLEILLSVRGSLQEVKDYMNRMKAYDSAIEQAVVGGQKARAEKLRKARKVVQQESMLLVSGFSKYLSEDQVIDFAVKCQKGLRLDWVENFGRPIPDAVLKTKVEADNLKVFDNYVVLHYDPKAEAFVLTEEQERAKKDPILFGLIEGSRKLYFVGDWKDDECDLTMEEVEKVLGGKAGEIDSDPSVE